MHFGFSFVQFNWPGGPAELAGRLATSAGILDEAGAETLWFMDHFFQIDPVGPAEQPMLEGYTALGYLAGQTRRANLGLLVTGITYRYPGILAKTLTTLDVLSGGRATLGIGAAWYEREHLGLGVPFPPVAERFERLEETLQICLQMWAGKVAPYEGRHYRLAETLSQPLPLTQPRPRILIGGGGERKTLLLVARYADACNLFPQSPEIVSGKLDVLRRHCESEGRDYDSIAKTILFMAPGLEGGAVRDALVPYRALGVEAVYFPVVGDPVTYAERFAAEVAPKLQDL
jgi:F420-dependent oxidoreductase-like protein